MQSVNDKYYIWYNRIIGAYGVVLAAITVAAWVMPSLSFLHEQWGFHPVIGVLGVIQAIYAMFFFRRQQNLWVACLLGSLILSLSNIGLVHNSGQFHSWFLIAWYLQVFMAGVYGLYTLVGCGFMITIYYVLEATGPQTARALNDPFAYTALGATLVVTVISYAFWRRLYIGGDSIQISKLAGQLQHKQQQAEIIIQSIGDGMIVTDVEGKINLLNPAASELTEWKVEEALGIDADVVTKFNQEDGKELPTSEHPFGKALKTREQTSSILQILGRNSKKPHVVSIVVSPILLGKDKELSGTVAVIRDISAAREEEHRRADFISTASHEMRTPVAAIEGYLQLALNDKVSRIDAKARDYLTKALESTHHLGKLFQDLLTSAKAEDGRLVNHPKVVEMGEYVEQMTEGLRFAAEKKGMLLDFVVGSGKDAVGTGSKVVKPLYYAHIDADRMQEVVTNLFDNAVKYSEKGRITVGLTGNNEVIQLFIKDTGQGIPPEDIPHLFQKFYRVDNSSTRTIGGTGLGLFICRKIVEMYNGRIWVESTVGKGSTFYINLPRLTQQKATELQTQENQQLV